MVGDNIKKYRILRGLKQSDLADRIGISQKTISSWELGRTEPSMGAIEKLASVLVCRKSDLVGDVEVIEALTPEELHLIIAFRKLSEAQQNIIVRIVDETGKRWRE